MFSVTCAIKLTVANNQFLRRILLYTTSEQGYFRNLIHREYYSTIHVHHGVLINSIFVDLHFVYQAMSFLVNSLLDR